MANTFDLDRVKERLSRFAQERDWEQFHSPKNLVMALSGEAGELCEIFQWLTEDQSREARTNDHIRTKVSEEMADVLIYLIRLSDIMDIDLSQAVWSKIEGNAEKYPVDRAKGTAKKYTEL